MFYTSPLFRNIVVRSEDMHSQRGGGGGGRGCAAQPNSPVVQPASVLEESHDALLRQYILQQSTSLDACLRLHQEEQLSSTTAYVAEGQEDQACLKGLTATPQC